MPRLHRVNDLIIHAIHAEAMQHKFSSQIILTGFTELTIPYNDNRDRMVFRSSPMMRGEEWYDWAFIRSPKSDKCHLARIWGIVRYETQTYPTYRRINSEREIHDSSIYCILDMSKNIVGPDMFLRGLVLPFELCNTDAGLEILPASSIIFPACVVTSWKSKESTHYLALAPKRRWAKLFSQRIRTMREGVSLDHCTNRLKVYKNGMEIEVNSPYHSNSNIEDTSDESGDST